MTREELVKALIDVTSSRDVFFKRITQIEFDQRMRAEQSKVKTYDLEDVGSPYESYREMVEQKDDASGAGDWVEIEDLRDAEFRYDELKKFLIDLQSDSEGVAGYHLNGDVAPWCEFEEIVNLGYVENICKELYT